MRTWGRINQTNGIGGQWVEVSTDESGYNDNVYLTALIQVLRLNLGESPFYADYGIPAHQSVITQVFPDYYAMITQQQFAQYFASLIITRVAGSSPPVYDVSVVCNNGTVVNTTVAS
mgnify:FL=1